MSTETLAKKEKLWTWGFTCLFIIGMLYPFFKDSAAWFAYGQKKLAEELQVQVYPDGLQYELSTNYQMVVIIYYMITVRMSRAYNRPVDPAMLHTLENMLLAYAKLIRPCGTTPDINDGYEYNARAILARAIDMYPENKVFRWVVSNGKEGTPPAKDSVVFPHAGLAALRSGWGKDDTYLFFDGGPFGKAHQHEDKLQVLFSVGEENILTETKRYAYDTSAMRQHCLATAGHSTVLVDGMGQNRRKNFEWKPEDIEKDGGLLYKLGENMDALRAVYNEGYGEEQDTSITHERSVYFFKKEAGAKPFAVIVDRLTAETEHDYEVQWHLDVSQLAMDGLQVAAGPLRLLVPQVPMETAGLCVGRGVQFPGLRGWLCNSMQLKDYRPVYAVQHHLHAQSIRWVTLLAQEDAFAGVEASLDVNDTTIILKKTDGSALELNEADLL
ncbi:MAG: alginate lyase family protein [Clostridia bacterium]|nr:alginate lyase family protein [Clostridia bacterium]